MEIWGVAKIYGAYEGRKKMNIKKDDGFGNLWGRSES